MTATVDSRVTGCILGGAIGDAFGEPFEFLSLNRILGNGVELDVPGLPSSNRMTDDTQMTLFGAAALMDTGINATHNEKLEIIRNAYLAWGTTQGVCDQPELLGPNVQSVFDVVSKQGWRVPGRTCLEALADGGRGSVTNKINDSKGCGGVMRSAPFGFVDNSFPLGRDAAAITHTHPFGFNASGAMSLLISFLLDGLELGDAVENLIDELQILDSEPYVRAGVVEAVELANGDGPRYRETFKMGEGWVAEEALAIAVYACLKAENFFEAIKLGAIHSGDSDSTAAIAGNIWGAAYGIESIDDIWVETVESSEFLVEFASRLGKFVCGWRIGVK